MTPPESLRVHAARARRPGSSLVVYPAPVLSELLDLPTFRWVLASPRLSERLYLYDMTRSADFATGQWTLHAKCPEHGWRRAQLFEAMMYLHFEGV